MISKIKKPVSILLVFMMIVSLFAAVPMTVNAAPPGATYTATFTFSPSLVGRYVETPGRGASNTMVFPDCDVYITGVTRTQTIHNTSVTYSHSIEGSYDVLYFNGQVIYRGDWAVPDGIRIVSGSGTSSDPYVTEWYSTPTITWKLDEDTVIDTTKVPFDAVPTHAAPTKEPDEEYTYTFAGWSPEPVAVTDDATYTATFTAVPRPYNVNVETAEHGTVTANPAEAAKGNQVTLTAEPDAGYALSSIKAFKKNTNSQQATLTALDGSSTGGEGYDKLVDGNTNTKWGFNGGSGYIIVKADKAFRLNDYSLTTANDTNNYSGRNWKNWGIYGANFASDSEAVKNSDQWQLVTSVTNDSKLQATNFTRYDYSVNTDPEAYQYYKIEISANKGDGYTQMSELTLSGANYDVEVVLMQDSADPAKYTFEMPASNVTVKAEFEAIPTYTVTWKNGDTTLKTDTVNKDAIPAYSGDVPTKAENEQYSYTFTGWTDSSNTFYSKDSNLPPVTKDETYTATYSETLRSYTITWKDGDDETLKSESVAYGTTPSYTGATPTKTEDDEYTYEFNNTWSPSVASVTGNATYTAQFTAVPKSAPTPKVAEVNGTKYETLEAAFAAAQDGNTITVLADCEGNGIVVPQGKFATGLTVDFGGHTYTVSGTPVGSRGTESNAFQLLKDNNITFQNGTITADCTVNPRDGKYLQRMIQNYSNLTLDNMTVSMKGAYYDQATISTCNGATVINNSTVSAPDFTWLGYNKSSEVGGVALTIGTFASYPSIDVTVTGGSTIDGDINVTDDNNKKAFSLSLESGTMTGNIILDNNAKAAIDDSTATASVNKAAAFNQAAPAGYKWVAKDDGQTLAPFTLQDYVDETFGNISGFTFADASASINGISANSASLVGVQIRQLPADTQTKEFSYDEEGNKEAGLRFVATMSKALYEKYENAAGFDYGFDINGHEFSCKDSVNNVAEGHEDITTVSDYAVMTLALKGFNDNNKGASLTVKFFVKTAADGTVYADYAKAGSTAKEFTTTYNQVAAALG